MGQPGVKNAFEFMFHYLADENLRNAALFQEKTGLQNFGLSNDDIVDLTSLKSAQIRAVLIRDVIAIGKLQGPAVGAADLIVDKMMALMKEVGFDADKAFDEIRSSPCADCEPLPAPADEIVTPMEVAAYGEGEVHVRRLNPRTVQVNRVARFDVRGQGFGPGVEARFVHTTSLTTIAAWIIDRYADIDVHQYLIVEALFSEEGLWKFEVSNAANQWTPAVCGVNVVKDLPSPC
jgi:hypothetical protein